MVDCDAECLDQLMTSSPPRRHRSLSPSRSPQSDSYSPLQGRGQGRVQGRGRGRSVSPDFAHTTYEAVQAAMYRRQTQVTELRVKLRSAHEQHRTLQRQLDDVSAERRNLDQSVSALTDDKHSL